MQQPSCSRRAGRADGPGSRCVAALIPNLRASGEAPCRVGRRRCIGRFDGKRDQKRRGRGSARAERVLWNARGSGGEGGEASKHERLLTLRCVR